MSTAIHYQPWLQAVLTIAKHYRIEASEERLRLQLDWNPNPSSDELVTLMGRQIGLQVRASAFSPEILNPWRLPVLIAMHDGGF